MAAKIIGTTIRMASGETGPVKFVVTEGETVESDRGIFTVSRRDGEAVFRKIIAPNMDEQAFDMMFVFKDTADLKAGEYDWSFRIVRDGAFNEEGRLKDAQMQETPIARGSLRIENVAGGAR